MPRSRLSAEDVRAVYGLVAECRELGDDPLLWRRHLLTSLPPLIGAALVGGGELSGVRAGSVARIGFPERGWQNDLIHAPTSTAYFSRMLLEDGVALTRSDLFPDDARCRLRNDEGLHPSADIDHILWCFRSVPETGDAFYGVVAARAAAESDFSTREKAVAYELIAVLGPLVGGALTRFGEPCPTGLPARTRRVLECLLAGDGDKQIASRLVISPYTVNGHVKAIFSHFGVQTRPELMSRWVKRGWRATCAWADDVGELGGHG